MKRTLSRLLYLVMILALATAFVPGVAEEVWSCPECGTEGLTKNFCSHCGYKRIVTWTCPECGEEGLTDNFCVNCGAAKGAMSALKAGDTYTFGHYDQDGDPSNGAEPIEWQVLESDGKTAKLISVKGLEAKAYNDELEDVTWEKCALRSWLNNDFLNTAFTPEEQSRLEITKVSADRNRYYVCYDINRYYYIGTDQALKVYDDDFEYLGYADAQTIVWDEDEHVDYDTDPGDDTRDRVWLLSVPEADTYFIDDDSRVCYPTNTSLKNGAAVDDNERCWWWLRSPGRGSDLSARVDYDGSVSRDGCDVDNDLMVVRPVVVVRLS